ncbi:hypothetical protein A2971_04340 [Candidatus Gottesmanbacteria bacterium RIFCSPLOWO2_01_FULL_46_21]|uniref:Glycosyltransferase 2-like domain-containing protein n=2 Tax=Microgenomates group TaxID=1794810 RepID=A0A1F6AZI5_9BACT|nr:MAG: Glycosyl transferase family 2 [Candidatus Curtissbacteria bacterium GW2011_GWA1_41_11]OGG29953.1 MAG: hypothetical protein A2971_04340 [Candidatus Gottesmanbacteria bacterium RIFCSPLOWO2_01_FULL_46_21]
MENKKIITVSIGIPAYNEEANIEHLLKALLSDTSTETRLSEIVVISDGSTDSTVCRVRSFRDSRIKVIDRKKRLGVVRTENEILTHVLGDILVVLDADVVPVESDFLDRITQPIRSNRAVGLVGASTVPLPSQTILERVITNSHYMKQHIYKLIRDGNNVYLCHGRARAFSKPFYKLLRWVDDCPEDAYSYFLCKTKGFSFVYANKAGVFFRSPQFFDGHVKQSTRFVAGIKKLKEIFGSEFIDKEYRIPRSIFLKTLLRYLKRNPFSTPAYIVITLFIRIVYSNEHTYKSRFSISQSSKRVVLYKGQKLSRV